MGKDQFTQNVERLEKALEGAKDTARECNEANAALRQTIKEAREVISTIHDLVAKETVNQVDAAVAKQIEDNMNSVIEHVQAMYSKTNDSFAKLVDPMMATLGRLELAVKLSEQAIPDIAQRAKKIEP